MAEPHGRPEPDLPPEPLAHVEPCRLLNALGREAAAAALRRACGAEGWVQRMLARRPFATSEVLYASADEEWRACTRAEKLEAFGHHPQIGESLEALRSRFQSTASLSQREQAGVEGADEGTLLALRDANTAYRERFGFIFIICATGKSARDMLAALRARLDNDADTELSIAAAEQAKITRLRLEGLASTAGSSVGGALTRGASQEEKT